MNYTATSSPGIDGTNITVIKEKSNMLWYVLFAVIILALIWIYMRNRSVPDPKRDQMANQ